MRPGIPTGDEPATVYRFYSADGDLLYVGLSVRTVSRLQDHSLNAHFWGEVAYAHFEHLSHREAVERERELIENCHPRHNKRHRKLFVAPVHERPADPHAPATFVAPDLPGAA